MKPSVSKLSVMFDESLQVKEEPEKMKFIHASKGNESFRIVITNESTLDKNVVDIMGKYTTFPVNEAENLVLSNPQVKKHLKPNMTIIEIIKVLRKAQKGLLKDPAAGSGNVFAGIGIKCETPSRHVYLEGNMMKVYMEALDFKVKRFSLDSRGIASCVKFNEGCLTKVRDVVFAGVLVILVHAGILIGCETATNNATDEEAAFVSEYDIKCADRLSRLVVKVALEAYSKGLEKLDRNDRFSNFGILRRFISESRIESICKAIFSFGTMNKVMDILTIGDFEITSQKKSTSTSNLKWLSTPELIKKALTIIPYPLVAGYFDPRVLLSYRQFEEAGLAAQIASGPLKFGCCGNTNPLAVAHIPPDLALSQLAPITDPPYHEPTIRMAKIILDAAGFNYGNWYQGKKASENMTFNDLMFNSYVEKVFSICSVDDLASIDGKDGLTREEVVALLRNHSAKREDQVAGVLRGWV